MVFKEFGRQQITKIDQIFSLILRRASNAVKPTMSSAHTNDPAITINGSCDCL